MPIPQDTREIPLTQGQVAIVDAADYEELARYSWNVHKGKGKKTYYARRTIAAQGGSPAQSFLMHRIILGISDPAIQIDHRDLNGLHNWRDNLRVATASQQSGNKTLRADCASGFRGVCWMKGRTGTKNWSANLQAKGVRRFIGMFYSAEAAARAYDEKALEHWGEFAQLNFPR
jgi:hypothetical protein